MSVPFVFLISSQTRWDWSRHWVTDLHTVVGHDFGSFVAAFCALTRPDVFQSVVMSAPFTGPPTLPFDSAEASTESESQPDIHAELAALSRPRKHYQWYYSTRVADNDMHHSAEGGTRFYEITSITRVQIGRGTNRSRSHPGRRTSWQRCRLTTLWTWIRTWPRPSRRKPWRRRNLGLSLAAGR